ncbi:hypothetical protein ACGFYA_17315 [Streptomyces sp. NPDC048305]|uniref:hypothetical protein n=1 Tax=Streptomyces sp. NPDC048305 TaxID=3365532 RepID=UPI00371A29FB
MTKMIEIPDAESDWEPATELHPSGRNPARQASMFQSATWPLSSLALLSVDLEAVARRLKLTLETSWDGHGSVRAACFVLDGTDFVITHHEGDAPGTHVWTRKGGPVDPAARAGSLLAALGVGPEAVSYSTWGVGTDKRHVPAAWGRGRGKPTRSHQDLWAYFRSSPELLVGRVTFGTVVAFLNGYDFFSEKVFLDGFREWLAAKLGYGRNLVYWVLAEMLIFPDGRPEEPWSPETEQHAVAGLIGLIDEYFDNLAGPPEERSEAV